MGICRSYVSFIQVLTGETPFHDVPPLALGYFVVRGRRPDKLENAMGIGLSDSLWDFTQRCWDGKGELRPEAEEVVMRLGEAACQICTNRVRALSPALNHVLLIPTALLPRTLSSFHSLRRTYPFTCSPFTRSLTSLSYS